MHILNSEVYSDIVLMIESNHQTTISCLKQNSPPPLPLHTIFDTSEFVMNEFDRYKTATSVLY